MKRSYTAVVAVIRSIKDGAKTREQIEADACLPAKSVNNVLRGLGDMVYVETWVKEELGLRNPAPAYRFTLRPKPDCPRPAPLTRREIDRRAGERAKAQRKIPNSVFSLGGTKSVRRSLSTAKIPRSSSGKFLPRDFVFEISVDAGTV